MADNPRCEEIRTERARLNKLADDMPGKLPPQPGDGPLGRPNPELRQIYDQINDLRKELLAMGCKP